MDRPIPTSLRRWRILRSVGLLSLAGAAIVVLLVLVLGWLRPSIRRDRIRTARVERGSVEATITASGTVVPAYEHIVTSPIAPNSFIGLTR